MRCRKNNHQFTFVNWEGPRVSKGNKRCPGSRYSLSIQCAGQWPFVAHMHIKIKISKISFNLSGAKSVLVIPRQVTMHTSQNQLGLDQGPVTVYSTLTSRSRHPWPSSESLDFNVVGVDHLPRLASAPSETRVNRFERKFGVNDRVQPIFVKLTDLTRASNLHSR